jgi:hypothetical protein
MDLDRRILQAALQPQPQQQWNPVIGFLMPLYRELLVAQLAGPRLVDGSPHAIRHRVRAAWDHATAAFRVLGFEYLPILGCKPIANESANERALNAAMDDAAKEAR